MSQRKSSDVIFWEAAQIGETAEREHYLARECGNDSQLRAKIEQLLTVRIDASEFLEKPPQALVTSPPHPNGESPGMMIGPYKLLQQIGEGGMGAVWMAEQLEPVRRRVAVKIIKPGMDSVQVIARFEAERQALALMNHPNIARVLDAGTISEVRSQKSEVGKDDAILTSDFCPLTSGLGRPFFVMELVKGVPITQYCDEQRLTPRQRVELLIPVCEAIHHAHRKGIIHRDIKPSNVLVCPFDGRPVPKVIDFGVAKATGQRLTDRTLFTEFGQVIGTLEYMSPEQAELNNLDIDTRSDIYSLGVLLYELLTGSTPFVIGQTGQAPLLEKLRTIREVDPPTPSNHLSTTVELPRLAVNRGLEPARLPSQIRGELDWIVMKCLEKDRNRRYESANDLALDLRRHLNDEQVQACPPSPMYRIKKVVRRNRVAVISAVVVFVVLVLGITGTSIGLARAISAEARSNNAANEARAAAISEHDARLAEAAQRKQAEAVAKLIESVFLDLDPNTSPEELKYKLVEQVSAVETTLERDYQAEPLLRARLLHAFGTVRTRLGDFGAAMDLHERALAVRRTHLGNEHADTLQSMRLLAGTYEMAAQRGDQAQWAKAYLLNDEWFSLVSVTDPNSDAALRAKTIMAFQQSAKGNKAIAVQMQEEVLAKRRELNGPDDSETIRAIRDLGVLYRTLDPAKELLLLEQSYEHARAKLGANDNTTLFVLNELAVANLLQKKYDRAIELYELRLELVSEKQGADSLAAFGAMNILGNGYQRASKFEKAISLYTRVIEGCRRKYPMALSVLDTALSGLAACCRGAGQHEKALEVQNEYVEILRARKGPDDPSVVQAMYVLGSNYIAADMPAKAIPVLEDVVKRRRTGTFNRGLPDALFELAVAQDDVGKLADAATTFREAATFYQKTFGDDNLNFARAKSGIGNMLLKLKQYPEAEKELHEALAIWEKQLPGTWSVAYLRSAIGAALLGQKKYVEAEPFLVKGYEELSKTAATAPAMQSDRVGKALENVVQLYVEWGKPEQAGQWRAKLPPKEPAKPKK